MSALTIFFIIAAVIGLPSAAFGIYQVVQLVRRRGQPGGLVIIVKPGASANVTINVYGSGTTEVKKPEVRDHRRDGMRLQESDRHRDAIEEFLGALAASEDDRQRSALHILIGNSFLALSRLDEAERHYRQALEIAERI